MVPSVTTSTVSQKKKVVHNTKLTPKQELFCKLYADTEEFFGDGTRAYMKVYGIPASRIQIARSAASRLLMNVNVCKKITEYISLAGFNEEFVDKQLLFIISQNKDLTAKNTAIKEFNSLKNRLKRAEEGDKEVKVVVEIVPFTGKSDGETRKDTPQLHS